MPNAPSYILGKQRIQDRKPRYHALKDGLLFKATHQTPGTAVTGQTSFVATTPTFLMQTSADTRRIVGLSLWLSQAGTVAGGTIDIVLAIDTAARYSSGGTAVTPQNSNTDNTTASGADFYYNPTASAAGSGTRYIWASTVSASLGTVTTYDFEDGLGVGTTGSILVYTWAATTGPTWRFGAEWLEE